jgi:hypothetical protein
METLPLSSREAAWKYKKADFDGRAANISLYYNGTMKGVKLLNSVSTAFV